MKSMLFILPLLPFALFTFALAQLPARAAADSFSTATWHQSLLIVPCACLKSSHSGMSYDVVNFDR
jgi:hypothetical protein